MWKVVIICFLAVVSEPFEEMYLNVGFKSVDDAVSECEKHFGRDINLPILVPPVTFTHQLGRCNTKGLSDDHNLEIEYFNEQEAGHHYKIIIKPSKQKPTLEEQLEHTHYYELSDSSKAHYGNFNSGKLNCLIFEKNGWRYLLIINSRVEKSVPVKKLLQIADSIKLSYPDPELANPLK